MCSVFTSELFNHIFYCHDGADFRMNDQIIQFRKYHQGSFGTFLFENCKAKYNFQIFEFFLDLFKQRPFCSFCQINQISIISHIIFAFKNNFGLSNDFLTQKKWQVGILFSQDREILKIEFSQAKFANYITSKKKLDSRPSFSEGQCWHD